MMYTLTADNSVELADLLNAQAREEILIVNDRPVKANFNRVVRSCQNGTLEFLVEPRRVSRSRIAQVFVKVGETFNVRSF